MRPRLLLFALGLLLLNACTQARQAPTSMPPEPAQPAKGPVPAQCPAHLRPQLLHHGFPGTGRLMVPGTPLGVVLCGPGSRVAVQGAVMRQLIAALNALKHFPSEGAAVCPIYVAPIYALFFNYAGGKVLTVTVSPSACEYTMNGQLSAYPNVIELNAIKALL